MTRFFLAFLLSAPLVWSASLLKSDIVSIPQGEGVALTLDAPFDGSIDDMQTPEGRRIIVSNLMLQAPQEHNLSGTLPSVRLEPGPDDSTVLTFLGSGRTRIIASKSTDGYTLRFLIPSGAPAVSALPVRKPETPAQIGADALDFGWRYAAVIIILGAMIAVMLWAKRRSSSGWLLPSKEKMRFEVLYQRPLDQRNKVVLFGFNGSRYLVLTGANNVLLDKSTPARELDASSERDFDLLLHQNEERLSQLIGTRDAGFERYKKNAEEQLFNL